MNDCNAKSFNKSDVRMNIIYKNEPYEGFLENSSNITNKSNSTIDDYNAKSFNKSYFRMTIINIKMNLMKGFLIITNM